MSKSSKDYVDLTLHDVLAQTLPEETATSRTQEEEQRDWEAYEAMQDNNDHNDDEDY